MSMPTLRFNEFNENVAQQNASKSSLIKDVANIQVGRDLNEDSFSETRTAKHKYPVYSNTVENYGLFGFYDFEEYDGNSLTIVGRGAGLGTAFARSSGFGAIGRLLVVSPKNNQFNVKYFAEYVNFKLQIHNESGGIPQLPGSTFGMYSIVLPNLAEQTKIANFLTAVDEKITQLTQKCKLLAQYKKGVMQQIFSQELRFKDDDGQEFTEWEEKALGEACEIVTGKTPSTTDVSLWDGDVQFVTPTDINEGKYQTNTARTVVEHSKLRVLPAGSIMFTCIASIGKMSLSTKPCITNQQINSLIPKSIYNNEYLYYALLSITEFIKSTQSSSTLPIINKTEFSKFIIPIPSKAEQTKIANFLTAIDDKITATQTQLQAAKQYKQGLLQQMFV